MPPLRNGKSQKTIEANIRELLASFKRNGKIGNVAPGSLAKAKKVAVAIALKKAGKDRKSTRKGKHTSKSRSRGSRGRKR